MDDGFKIYLYDLDEEVREGLIEYLGGKGKYDAHIGESGRYEICPIAIIKREEDK